MKKAIEFSYVDGISSLRGVSKKKLARISFRAGAIVALYLIDCIHIFLMNESLFPSTWDQFSQWAAATFSYLVISYFAIIRPLKHD